MSDDEAASMNLRAYLALDGSTMDWRLDLARLLRSDIPLDRSLRNRIAALVENVTDVGPRLDLNGHKSKQDRFVGVAKRHEWMEIGRWVNAYVKRTPESASATQAAADHFNQGKKKVEAAVTYYNRVTLWTDRAMESDAGKVMGREWVERLYHSITVNPEMKMPNYELLRQIGLSH